MKTKNNLTNGILIGIGVIVLPLVLMGTTYTNTDNEVGRYQLSTERGMQIEGLVKVWCIYETIIDTKNGEVISRKRIKLKEWEKVK